MKMTIYVQYCYSCESCTKLFQPHSVNKWFTTFQNSQFLWDFIFVMAWLDIMIFRVIWNCKNTKFLIFIWNCRILEIFYHCFEKYCQFAEFFIAKAIGHHLKWGISYFGNFISPKNNSTSNRAIKKRKKSVEFVVWLDFFWSFWRPSICYLVKLEWKKKCIISSLVRFFWELMKT